MPCQCGNPKSYEILGHKCVRCYRDSDLFALSEARDKAEIEFNNMDSLCYRIEILEGLRPPPVSDRPAHDVQGEPAMGILSANDAKHGGFSSPMKQARRSTITSAQDMTDEE